MSFKKNLQINYKDDIFYNKAVELIGLNNPLLTGSYIKYGKDKSCDMDLSEKYNFDSLEKRKEFLKYVNKILNNKKKNNYDIVKIKFEMNKPYNKLKNIYDLLNSMDGLFNYAPIEKNILDNIYKCIDLLPFELKIKFNDVFDKYIKNKNIANYIILLNFIYDNMYPSWSISECKKGKKKYYDEEYNILNIDQHFYYFYIEIIYDNFRISNYFLLISPNSVASNKDNQTNDVLNLSISDLVSNNKISYYYYLKKIGYFMKWLYFNRKLDNTPKKRDVSKNINEFNNLFDFRERIGLEHNKYCIIKNKIDIYNIKLIKYTNKKNNKKTNKYYNFISKYEKRISKLTKEYNRGLSKIDDTCENYFNNLLKIYEKYILKYIVIK